MRIYHNHKSISHCPRLNHFQLGPRCRHPRRLPQRFPHQRYRHRRCYRRRCRLQWCERRLAEVAKWRVHGTALGCIGCAPPTYVQEQR